MFESSTSMSVFDNPEQCLDDSIRKVFLKQVEEFMNSKPILPQQSLDNLVLLEKNGFIEESDLNSYVDSAICVKLALHQPDFVRKETFYWNNAVEGAKSMLDYAIKRGIDTAFVTLPVIFATAMDKLTGDPSHIFGMGVAGLIGGVTLSIWYSDYSPHKPKFKHSDKLVLVSNQCNDLLTEAMSMFWDNFPIALQYGRKIKESLTQAQNNHHTGPPYRSTTNHDELAAMIDTGNTYMEHSLKRLLAINAAFR